MNVAVQHAAQMHARSSAQIAAAAAAPNARQGAVTAAIAASRTKQPKAEPPAPKEPLTPDARAIERLAKETMSRTLVWTRLPSGQYMLQVVNGNIELASGVGQKEDALLDLADEMMPPD
ncbi:MAG TPA: hypothetical protein VMR97_07410 [Acidimicrobiales bacterium]|nr:hypothetical protein [Acidimicrobiales bacterium]